MFINFDLPVAMPTVESASAPEVVNNPLLRSAAIFFGPLVAIVGPTPINDYLTVNAMKADIRS